MPFHTLIRPLRALLSGAILFSAFAQSVFAQQNIKSKIDQLAQQAMKDENIPGMAVAVVQNGKVLYKNTYGVRSVKDNTQPDDNTVFSIGSVSKAFTAIGLMELVQQGKIALDAPINRYMKNLPAAWGNITIRQFMTHTSGIPELKGDKDKGSFDETVKEAAALPMSFQPGKRQQYNNFNFAIMGKLIETVTDMPYLDYMNKNVFGPAGMTTTGVKLPTNNVTTGHLPRKDKLTTIISHFEPGDYGVPSGGLQTTLADFVKLSQALNNNNLLNKATIQAMWTPYSASLSNTPGWHTRMAGNLLIVHKGGGGTGIGSVCDFKIVPSRNIYVVVMINRTKMKLSPADFNDQVLEQCFSIPAGEKGKGDGDGD